MKKVGIFGGSFNPIHVGHVALAKALREHCHLDEVWLMVSPQNPLKQQADLLDDRQRYEMAQLALRDVEGVRASDYEFQLPIAESGQGWQIRSKGQVMIYQVLSVGKDPGNAEGYNPATSADVSGVCRWICRGSCGNSRNGNRPDESRKEGIKWKKEHSAIKSCRGSGRTGRSRSETP